ncbi:MAG: class III extradiol dioxygenase subunit B-like domain-containing protein [bacterium]
MPLIFSAIVPHSPVLIPSVGKDDTSHLAKTIDAYKTLNENLYAAKPQTIIVISSHKKNLDSAFSINLSEEYAGNFKSFGDFSPCKFYKNDAQLSHHIREILETKIPIKLFSENELEYGVSIPLYYLTEHLNDISIIPLHFSNLDYNCHFALGQALKDILLSTNKKAAVIASADLSHALLKNSPETYSPDGAKFDKKLISLIRNKDIKNITRISSDLVKKAMVYDFRAILILMGILEEINYEPEILSYEFPFGVGYLTANFKIM